MQIETGCGKSESRDEFPKPLPPIEWNIARLVCYQSGGCCVPNGALLTPYGHHFLSEYLESILCMIRSARVIAFAITDSTASEGLPSN